MGIARSARIAANSAEASITVGMSWNMRSFFMLISAVSCVLVVFNTLQKCAHVVVVKDEGAQ